MSSTVDLIATLKKKDFGYEQFRPLQQFILDILFQTFHFEIELSRNSSAA
jgi:hypothetical protein